MHNFDTSFPHHSNYILTFYPPPTPSVYVPLTPPPCTHVELADTDVVSPTERLASGDASPLQRTFAPGQMAARTPSVSSQEQWQQQCSDSMRQLALRILDPAHHENAQQDKLERVRDTCWEASFRI